MCENKESPCRIKMKKKILSAPLIFAYGDNNFSYFFICACLLIFFDFLQSDWLQQRAAFYDILTAVQKCHFLPVSFVYRVAFKFSKLIYKQ